MSTATTAKNLLKLVTRDELNHTKKYRRRMNTPRIILITLAVFACTAVHAVQDGMQFKLTSPFGRFRLPVFIDKEAAAATSEFLKNLLTKEDPHEDPCGFVIEVATTFSHGTMNVLVTAMYGAYRSGNSMQKTQKAIAATPASFLPINGQELLQAARHFEVNSVVLAACKNFEPEKMGN